MHVGHIRSIFLGDSLARIAAFLGHEVIRDNHLGDWGTQFGMVIYGWKNFLDREALAARSDCGTGSHLQRDERTRDDRAGSSRGGPTGIGKIAGGRNGELRHLEGKRRAFDAGIRARLSSFSDIHYDIQRGESFYNDRLPDVVERLLKSKIAEMSEGAVCVFFRDIPELADKPAMIRKRDGGYNYATTDVATVDYRIHDLKADTVWAVVGAPQSLHFKQIFEIARREGYKADFRHIPFGSILGEDRKLMKTRSGENVPLGELLEEAIARARKIVEQKNPDLPESEKNEIARIIGLGAVKYADLSQYRMTDYVFSWDKMLSLHGNTAPYLQNAYVRIRSIFRKAVEGISASAKITLSDPAEIQLAKRLTQFAEIVPSVLNDFRPNVLANYLFELANSFHTFYEACPVLKADEPTRQSRLALSELTGRTLQRGLDLLGIRVPEKM